MIRLDVYYELSYLDNECNKWLYIRFELSELDKVRRFIAKRRITKYKLNMVEIKLHNVVLGV